MAKPRSYGLLCPIARGLDRIGDRWTLLILRDLLAGPARFTDLQKGLTGIAANLLTDRLAKLLADGLVAKVEGAHGAMLYELTDRGAATRDIIFELAIFGAGFDPEGDIVAPGNLRTVAVTLGTACQRVVTAAYDFEAAIVINGEQMTLKARNGRAEMLYRASTAPDVSLETSYDALLKVSEGELDLTAFVTDRCLVNVRTPGKDTEMFALLTSAIGEFSG
ncbi:transcriptional regulator, HxlR family [Jannaschia faecimaris]|uniref:Transcriptional regulator, HxlR family n=1 Tax=Jannaschia faecimaris TaxID=1244108 RepID=A0A1H3MSM6_9RHOB|nr:helix-turn-helix domain-containing protein [Jannaschia faecimaris]SDY79636.1 transcriptional regulator, HxlR family [Jannaschia faecimaris]